MSPSPVPPSSSTPGVPSSAPGDAAPTIGPKSVRPVGKSGNGGKGKKHSWFWGGLKVLTAVVIAAGSSVGVYYGVREMRLYSQGQTEKRIWNGLVNGQTDLRIDFTTRPAWIHPDLLKSILGEGQRFSKQQVNLIDHSGALVNLLNPGGAKAGQRDTVVTVPNYFRLCNPLDEHVLKELHEQFTTQVSERQKAWIKQIKSIHREELQVGGSGSVGVGGGTGRVTRRVTIKIEAEFRQAVAFVEQGGNFYLVDAEGVLLPGVYSAQDRKLIHGMLAIKNARGALPEQVGEVWNPASGDAQVGIALARYLSGKPFTTQISAIDLANLDGRVDAVGPWITLDTIFPLPEDPSKSTQVYWGRPMGQEGVREIKAAAKLKALHDLYTQFGRIDAGRAYVNIRLDEIQIPMETPAADSATPVGTPTPAAGHP